MTHANDRPKWGDFSPELGPELPLSKAQRSISGLPSGILPSGEANFYDVRQTHFKGSGINQPFPFPNTLTKDQFKYVSGNYPSDFSDDYWDDSGVIRTYAGSGEISVNALESGIFSKEGENSPFSNGNIIKQTQISDFAIFNGYIHHERFPGNSTKDFDKKDLLIIPYISDYDVSIDWNPYKG